jgi:pimeloyl-ACP methyl ester carboxylesterase
MPVTERRRSVTAGGVRLAVREWPATGRPPVLLLHGLASTSHIWDLVVPRLAGDHHVASFDQRGHGESGKPTSGYGFERTTADALAVTDALGLRRPVVVGHSWGASVALQLATRHARRVAGVALLDGGFLPLRERMTWAEARERLAPPELAGMPVDRFLDLAAAWAAPHLDPSPALETLARSIVRVDRAGHVRPRLSRANHLRILRAMWEQDPLELLAAVRVPTLVLGTRVPDPPPDERVFAEAKRTAAQTVRRIGGTVRFEWIAGIHDVPMQRPSAVARRIARFVREAHG